MSKVYSFRLDENNPREAQAKEVIDAWVSQGYSLRNKLVDLLIHSQEKSVQDIQFEKIFEHIENLVNGRKEEKGMSHNLRESLSDRFVGSLVNSVKDGLTIE